MRNGRQGLIDLLAVANHLPRRSRPEIPDDLRMGARLQEHEHGEDIGDPGEADVHV
jgi:hypothetical protein